MIKHDEYLWKRTYRDGVLKPYVTRKYAKKINSICNNEKRVSELLGLIAMFPLLRDEELFLFPTDNVFVLDDITGFDFDKPDDYSYLSFLKALDIEESNNGDTIIDVLSSNQGVKNLMKHAGAVLEQFEFDEQDLSVIQKVSRLRQIAMFDNPTHNKLFKDIAHGLFEGVCNNFNVVVYQGLEPLQTNAIIY